MLDKIMRLFGYENIDNILIQKNYMTPNVKKIKCKAKFYAATGNFQDKVIINHNKILLDGYVTYTICKWQGRRYIKVLKVWMRPEEYKHNYKFYQVKTKEERGKRYDI